MSPSIAARTDPPGLTRRKLIVAGLIASCSAAAAPRLHGVLADGVDGVLSAGLMVRGQTGRIAFAGAAGRRITAAGGEAPFGLGDPFRVASVSKMVAAIGFMRLVEAGEVSLNDAAETPLGFGLRHPAFPDRAITIRQLLSHTSGLRNGPSYPVPAGHRLSSAFTPGGAHFDAGAWFGPATHPPGAWFAYADVNYALIAQIIERLTDRRFDHYMTSAVLRPLGLDAGYNWSGVTQAKRDRAAPAARWIDGGWKAQADATVPRAPASAYPPPTDATVPESKLAVGQNGFLFSPQGGLRLSLRDMDRLAVAFVHKGGGLVHPATLALMQTPVWRFDPASANGETGEAGADQGVFGAYGLGVEIPGAIASDRFFGAQSADWRGHLGDAYGWLSGLFWNIRTRETLVYALNGVREYGRPSGRRSALTPAEETLIDLGLTALRRR